MKKVFLIILSITLIITGCENIDFGDTNKNVNGPSEANTATLLSGAMTNFATRTGRPYRITPTLMVQYFMQLVYNDEMLYAETPGYWSSYYVQTTSNLKEVIDICSAEGAGGDINIISNGALANQIAVATIFKAVIFKRTTDLFGDIPYSKSLSIESLTPEYDAQEDIYASLISDVVAARDMIDVNLAGPTGDAIYGGDMELWGKFANSFLMQMALQLSEAGSTKIDAEDVFVEALGDPYGVIESLADEAWYVFDIDNGFDNPWSWMRSADYGISSELIHSMNGTGTYKVTSNTTPDRRLHCLIADTTAQGVPYGYRNYGTDSDFAGMSPATVNTVIISAGTNLPLLTSAYTYLNRAEAAARGWTTEDVNALLTAGIQASFARFDALYNDGSLDLGDGTAYAAARVADVSTVAGGALQVIGEEKWVDLFPLGYDSWSEHRRTNVPVLQPAAHAINDGNIPTRYNYPSDEASLNTANYEAGKSGLSPAEDKNTSKVWWDK